MKPATVRVISLSALPAIALVWAGCQGIAVEGAGYTQVYGDYGYVGPWDNGRVEVGYIVAPPYGRPDQDRRDEDARRRDEDARRAAPAPEQNRQPERPAPDQHGAPNQHQAPDQRQAPVQRPAPEQHQAPVQRAAPQPAAPRPIPSIPNNPRPAPQRGANDRTQQR